MYHYLSEILSILKKRKPSPLQKKKKKSTPFLVGTIRNLDSIKEKKEIRKNHRNLKELDEELSMSINSRLYTHRHTDR